MKLFVVFAVILNLFACVLTKPIRESGFLMHPKTVVLVDNADDCSFKEVLHSTHKEWADNNDDKVVSGVLHLKALANEKGYNAISKVKLESLNFPNGVAEGLICSDSKFSRFRDFQSDESWIRKHILIGK